MLPLVIEDTRKFNNDTGEFIDIKGRTIQLEHSLISLSKWESKWCKPFLSNKSMSIEETIDYIKCMTVTQNVPDELYLCITDKHISQVDEYIHASMTATTFSARDDKRSREVITNELVYYWMISLNIPFECEKWHLNRLLTLIQVCSVKNAPPKKMSKKDLINRNRSLNAQRRAALGSRG